MATYATQADFEAYVEGWVTDDAAALERLLQRAERDVDNVLGPVIPRTDTGLKLNPATLRSWEAKALSNATCAQAEHRWRTGDANLGGRLAGRVRGPDFEVDYAPSDPRATNLYGPRVALELARIAHLRRLGGYVRR